MDYLDSFIQPFNETFQPDFNFSDYYYCLPRFYFNLPLEILSFHFFLTNIHFNFFPKIIIIDEMTILLPDLIKLLLNC
jgi:hypothetical protein